MNSNLAVRAKGLREMLEASKLQIAMALPRHMTPERMIRVALTAARKDSKILRCSLTSIVGAVVEASQLGLEPDGVLGYAYLVPYKDVCTLIPGYKGLIALAKRTGDVANIWANPVFEGDTFDYMEGLHRDLKHRPNLDTENREDPRKLTYVYAVVTFKDGRDPDFEVMTAAQVRAIQDRSRAKAGPWQTDFVEMARKTAIKRLLKRHDLSPEVRQAQAMDDAMASGSPFDFSERVQATVGAGIKETEPAPSPDRQTEPGRPGPESRSTLDVFADDMEDEGPGDEETGEAENQQRSPEDGPDADEAKPDRRRRATCVATLREAIRRLGNAEARRLRDGVLAEHGLPPEAADVDSMDLDVLRHLTRVLEHAPTPEKDAS